MYGQRAHKKPCKCATQRAVRHIVSLYRAASHHSDRTHMSIIHVMLRSCLLLKKHADTDALLEAVWSALTDVQHLDYALLLRALCARHRHGHSHS